VKVIALVESLPAEAPAGVKRAIVSASLEAFGVRIDRVLAAANGAVSALEAEVAAQSELARAASTEKARVRAALDFFDAREESSIVRRR